MLILGAFIFSKFFRREKQHFLEETLLEIKKKKKNWRMRILSAPYFSKFFGGKNKIY